VTSTLHVWAAWAVMSVTVVLLALGRALSSGQWQWTVEFITAALGNALIVLACAAVGLLITSRRAGQRDRLDLRPGRPGLRHRPVCR
jgi:hypothetical protein